MQQYEIGWYLPKASSFTAHRTEHMHSKPKEDGNEDFHAKKLSLIRHATGSHRRMVKQFVDQSRMSAMQVLL